MAEFDAVSVINIVEWVLSIIVTGLISGITYTFGGSNSINGFSYAYSDIHKTQVVDCVVFGYLIILTIQIVSNFAFNQAFPKNMRLVIAVLGFILWLIAAAFILECADRFSTPARKGELYGRIISAGILGIANSLTFIVETFFIYKTA